MSFYANIPPEHAIELEELSRLMYELRAGRDGLLAKLGAEDEAQALARIASGELPEHPSYEHYLSVRILADLHAQVRADLAARIAETQTS